MKYFKKIFFTLLLVILPAILFGCVKKIDKALKEINSYYIIYASEKNKDLPATSKDGKYQFKYVLTEEKDKQYITVSTFKIVVIKHDENKNIKIKAIATNIINEKDTASKDVLLHLISNNPNAEVPPIVNPDDNGGGQGSDTGQILPDGTVEKMSLYQGTKKVEVKQTENSENDITNVMGPIKDDFKVVAKAYGLFPKGQYDSSFRLYRKGFLKFTAKDNAVVSKIVILILCGGNVKQTKDIKFKVNGKDYSTGTGKNTQLEIQIDNKKEIHIEHNQDSSGSTIIFTNFKIFYKK